MNLSVECLSIVLVSSRVEICGAYFHSLSRSLSSCIEEFHEFIESSNRFVDFGENFVFYF